MRVSSYRQREAARIVRKARRQHVDDLRREDERDRQQHDLARQQQREDAVGEQPGALRPALFADARIGRHEGGVEGAFREDGAEMVGQAQRDKEGVGRRSRAQDRGQHDIAHETGRPRKQREAADREDALNHRSVVPWPRKDAALNTFETYCARQR